jgi:nucleotide-binding universal stress UspA family protein
MTQRIVVGVDGSEPAHEALRWAVAEAVVREAELEVVHVWHYPSNLMSTVGYVSPVDVADFDVAARTELAKVLHSVDLTELSMPVVQTLVCGVPASELIGAAKGADLLVVGSRGRGGFAGLLLGSVSQQVAHHAPCPLVIVPCPET